MEEKMMDMMWKMMEQMTSMRSEMNERFDAVDSKLNGVGEQFEELSKNNLQLRDDMKKELKYVAHKINELDREVFMRTDSLQ